MTNTPTQTTAANQLISQYHPLSLSLSLINMSHLFRTLHERRMHELHTLPHFWGQLPMHSLFLLPSLLNDLQPSLSFLIFTLLQADYHFEALLQPSNHSSCVSWFCFAWTFAGFKPRSKHPSLSGRISCTLSPQLSCSCLFVLEQQANSFIH